MSTTYSNASLIRLIHQSLDRLELNLEGYSVLTEGAAGYFASTPIIALLAGADRVFSLTKDSPYGSYLEVEEQLLALIREAGLPQYKFSLSTTRDLNWFRNADIVTNLNFVRPISAEIIQVMKIGSVIPLMFEAWEFRHSDLDLEACHRRGVKVVATNEHFPLSNVFGYTGWLGLKLLLEAEIEIFRSRIIIISEDLFGLEVNKLLTNYADSVHVFDKISEVPKQIWKDADAIIIADFKNDDLVIGPNSPMPIEKLMELNPHITIIPYIGWVDTVSLKNAGFRVHPQDNSCPRRMSRTLAYLGPRPIIDLHVMGLKCAELVIKNSTDPTYQGLYQLL
jgi:hypothetical protein